MKPAMPAQAESSHLSHPKYRPDIDGLRAIAVLSVVGFHAFPNWIPGGYVGVDVFFVISGFLISSIIFSNLEKSTFSYAEFYSRRIKRIFPALAVVLTVTWAVGWYVLLSDEYRQLGKHIAAGAGFVSNLMLWAEAGYFDNTADLKPLLHLWSLGVEEQFYIVWPVLLGIVWKFKHEFLRITLLVAAASFMLNVLTVSDHPVAAYYSPLARFWELMVGGLLAYVTLHTPERLQDNKVLKALLGLVLIALGMVVLNESSKFPGWWALLPTVGAALLIAAGPTTWVNRRILGNPIMVGIGLISYPLYLWHWPLLSFARIIEAQTPSRNVRLLLVVAAVALAWLTYALIEKRVRRSSSRRVVFGFAAAMAVLFGCGILIWMQVTGPRNGGADLERVVQAFEDWEFPPEDFQSLNRNGQVIYSQAGSAGNTLFIGDSHIQQYAPRVSKLLKEHPNEYNSVTFATTGGCPPIPGLLEDKHPECARWLNEATKLAGAEKFDAIVVGACWDCYFIDMVRKKDEQAAAAGGPASYEYYYLENGEKKYFRQGTGSEPALAALQRYLAELSTHGRVYLVLDNPRGGQFHPKTFFEGTRLTQLSYTDSIKQHELTSEQKTLTETMREIANRANAKVIDPTSHLCKDDRCPTTFQDGKPIYKDSNHFRRLFSEQHADFIDVTLMNSQPNN